MSLVNPIKKKSFLILFILSLWGCEATAQRKDEKTKYIGIHESEMKIMEPTDTISASIFFTHDSFTLIFMIANDSDYRYPMYKGTWAVTAGEEVDSAELRFNNGAIKAGVFEQTDVPYGISINFQFDGIYFYQPMRIGRRTEGIKK